MKIRAKEDLRTSLGVIGAGEEEELPQAEAEALVAKGKAVAVIPKRTGWPGKLLDGMLRKAHLRKP